MCVGFGVLGDFETIKKVWGSDPHTKRPYVRCVI